MSRSCPDAHGFAAGNVRTVFDLRDLEVPVVSAPMAGGPSTPALAAAVSDAGGLGFLAAGYKTPDKVAAEAAAVREATAAPFGINLFVIEPYDPNPDALEAYRRSLEPEAARFGVSLGDPRWDDDRWAAKLDLLFDVRPDIVSFTFGCPSGEVLRRLSQAGVHCAVTVTTPTEAREAVERGAASLCVQGPEAGGHRGTWSLDATPDQLPLLDVLDAVLSSVEVPVVAAGGLMDAAGVDAVLERGAVSAQAGTAYLLAGESGTSSVHRSALADPAFDRTEITRAYTGRWARGLANRFVAEHTHAPAAYPHLHHLTAPLRAAAVSVGDAHVAHLWAGTGQAHVRSAAAGEITRSLRP